MSRAPLGRLANEPAVRKRVASSRTVLTIVIPALNEEEAIASTISRCLAARVSIARAAGLDDVEVIVVSDGSTDRTAEIATSFDEVQVVVFGENRGYGAAIKEGFRRGTGDLVGFLDADGTCDPSFFGEMCRHAVEDSADVVIGSRLGRDSEMPRVRRLGNRLYATLLGFLSGKHIVDTASGMRVVRRSALRELYPLPDGLHFTPSLSARALLNDMRVIEVPMSYNERIGQSKLNVLRDGVRFLRTIIGGVLCYRPEKIFLFGFLVCALSIVVMAAYPTEYYLAYGRLQEWMVYRFVVCGVLASFGLLLLLATALTHRMAALSRRRAEATTFWPPLVSFLFDAPFLGPMILALLAVAILFLWPGLLEYASTGEVYLHWSRLLAGAFALFGALQVAVFAVLMKVGSIWSYERRFEAEWHANGGSRRPEVDAVAVAESPHG